MGGLWRMRIGTKEPGGNRMPVGTQNPQPPMIS